MRLFLLAGAAMLAATPASAGAFSGAAPGGAQYSFTECARPAAPDIAVDKALKGRARVAARNAAVVRHNQYVGAVNAYFQCIAGEAERDMKDLSRAIQSAVESEQAAFMRDLEAQRATIDAR